MCENITNEGIEFLQCHFFSTLNTSIMKIKHLIILFNLIMFANNVWAQWDTDANGIYYNQAGKSVIIGSPGAVGWSPSKLIIRQTDQYGLRFERPTHKSYEISLIGSKGLAFRNLNLAQNEIVFDGTGKISFGIASSGGNTFFPTGRIHIWGNSSDNTTATGNGGLIVAGDNLSTNIAIDDNEIMARNNGVTSTLGLQEDGGTITIHGRSSDGNKKLIITDNGDFGVGTTTIPTGYKLAVDGKIISEELKVKNSSSWPDYVFEKEYPLQPLLELEQSIQQNGHLPGIPSAAEVEANGGIEVGAIQLKLLEKIEELTLYMILLKKENDELKLRLENLKRK
jgi:hypothetical protein